MVTVTGSAPARAPPEPGPSVEGVFPGQPRQAVSRATEARSARRTEERIGRAEHATGEGARKNDVCEAGRGGGRGSIEGRTTGEGQMRQARRFLGMGLLLATTGAVAADSGRTSVIAVGKCDEASAIAA